MKIKTKRFCYIEKTHCIFNILGLKIKINHRTCLIIVRLLDCIVIKNSKKIVINAAPKINDNAIAYYNFLQNNYSKQYEMIWITTTGDFNIDFPKKYHMYSLKGIYHFLTSKYVVICTPNNFLDYFKSKRRVYVNLYHGMPIKLIGFINKQNLSTKNLEHLSRYKFLGENAQHFVTSDLFKHLMNNSFRGNYNDVYITGQPRTDMIWEEEKIKRAQELFQFDKYDKVVFYLPTYMEGCNKEKFAQVSKEYNNIFYMDDYKQSQFISMLEERNILFVMKPHPTDERFYQEHMNTIPKSKNFKMIFQDYLNKNNVFLYNLFPNIDLMISDFSSVTLDYLILNRPVIYLDNLSKEYSQNRGMTLEDNYYMLMPGHKVKTYKELEEKIIDSLTVDSTKELREKTMPLIHKYQDNKACERIYEIMKRL